MMLYSVHDTSVAALLLALDIFDNKWPDFAADLAFELYRDKVMSCHLKSHFSSYGILSRNMYQLPAAFK